MSGRPIETLLRRRDRSSSATRRGFPTNGSARWRLEPDRARVTEAATGRTPAGCAAASRIGEVGLATLGVGHVNIRGFATRFRAGQWLQRIRERIGRGGLRQGAQAMAFAP